MFDAVGTCCGFAWFGREHVPRNCAPWMLVEEVVRLTTRDQVSTAELRHTLQERGASAPELWQRGTRGEIGRPLTAASTLTGEFDGRIGRV